MTILVTGGTGYIGSHTVVELLEQGNKVVIVDNLSNSDEEVIDKIEIITNQRPIFYQGDLLDNNLIDKIFIDNNIDAVIHFAGLKAVGESVSHPLKYYENNITSTINLLNSMSKFNVNNLVFSSSATVYGMHNPSPLNEDMPTETTNPYGATKQIIERILKDLYNSNNEWNISILRYFNPIGAHKTGLIGEDPKDVPNNLMPYIVKVAVREMPHLYIYGNEYDTHDGTGVRDYIHVLDLSRGHTNALNFINKNKGFHVHNLGTGVGYSVLDLVKTFEKVNNVKIPYKIVARRKGDVGTCYADSKKAIVDFGWNPRESIDTMCKDSYRFAYRKYFNEETND